MIVPNLYIYIRMKLVTETRLVFPKNFLEISVT